MIPEKSVDKSWLHIAPSATGYLLLGFGPIAFTLAPSLTTPLLALFVISVIAFSALTGNLRQLLPTNSALFYLVGGLLALSALSIAWSIAPERSSDRLLKLIPIALLLFVVMSPAAASALKPVSRGLLIAGSVSCGLGMSFAAADIAMSIPVATTLLLMLGEPEPIWPFAYNRGLSFLLLFSIPCLCWLLLSGRKSYFYLLLAATACAAYFTWSNSMALAFLVATAVSIIAVYWGSRITGIALFLFIAAVAVVQPFLFNGVSDHFGLVDWNRGSVFGRLEIWDYVSLAILDRPFLGWGLDTTRFLPTLEDRLHAFSTITKLSNHAHNNFLEVWNNLGIGGLAILLGILFHTIKAALTLPDMGPLRAMALGGIAAGVTIAFLAFGLWQSTWLSALIIAVLMFRLLAIEVQPTTATQPRI